MAYITKYVGQSIKHLMSLTANASYVRFISKFMSINQYQCWNHYTNQKGRDIPLLCKNNYTLGLCTFEAGVHYLELVHSLL